MLSIRGGLMDHGMAEPILADCRAVESRPSKNGYALRCPLCGAWLRMLVIVAWQPEPVCARCAFDDSPTDCRSESRRIDS